MIKNKTIWRKMKLDEGDGLSLIIDHRGITPKKLGGNWDSVGIPALSAKNIKNGQIINQAGIRYVSQKLYDRWMREKLRPGDVLLTSEAPLGELYFLKEKKDYCLSQRLFALRANPNILNPNYLYYFLKSVKGQHELMRRISGTAAQGIRQAELRKVEISAPVDILEQHRIVSALSAFDDKIELNNKISRTLEQTAQAIFKEWFVNFKFFGHEKVKMVDSELGKIPVGWGVKKFFEIAHLNRGVSYSSKEISAKEGGLPMINLANFLRGGGFNSSGVKHYTGVYKDSHLVKPGQIIIAMTDLTSNREVIGHPARVPEDFSKALISLDVCSINTEDIYVEFLYSLMLRRSFSQLMAGSASGTNVSHLNKTNIEEYLLILPSRDLLPKFNKLIRPMFTQQINLSAENQKLAALRDLLLPKLMSGEIRL